MIVETIVRRVKKSRKKMLWKGHLPEAIPRGTLLEIEGRTYRVDEVRWILATKSSELRTEVYIQRAVVEAYEV